MRDITPFCVDGSKFKTLTRRGGRGNPSQLYTYNIYIYSCAEPQTPFLSKQIVVVRTRTRAEEMLRNQMLMNQ